MARSVEIKGKLLSVGDTLRTKSGVVHIRGFNRDNVPTAGEYSPQQIKDMGTVVGNLLTELTDVNTFQQQMARQVEKQGRDGEFLAMETIVRGMVHDEVDKHEDMNDKDIVGNQVVVGLMTLAAMRKAELSTKDFEVSTLATSLEGIKFQRKCPFKGVARMLSGSVYTVMHGKR